MQVEPYAGHVEQRKWLETDTNSPLAGHLNRANSEATEQRRLQLIASKRKTKPLALQSSFTSAKGEKITIYQEVPGQQGFAPKQSTSYLTQGQTTMSGSQAMQNSRYGLTSMQSGAQGGSGTVSEWIERNLQAPGQENAAVTKREVQYTTTTGQNRWGRGLDEDDSVFVDLPDAKKRLMKPIEIKVTDYNHGENEPLAFDQIRVDRSRSTERLSQGHRHHHHHHHHSHSHSPRPQSPQSERSTILSGADEVERRQERAIVKTEVSETPWDVVEVKRTGKDNEMEETVYKKKTTTTTKKTSNNVENRQQNSIPVHASSLRALRTEDSAPRIARSIEDVIGQIDEMLLSASRSPGVQQTTTLTNEDIVDAGAVRPLRTMSQTNVYATEMRPDRGQASDSNIRQSLYDRRMGGTTYSAHKEQMNIETKTVEQPGEVFEEIETITLQPIGKGVHDLEASSPFIGSLARTPRGHTPSEFSVPANRVVQTLRRSNSATGDYFFPPRHLPRQDTLHRVQTTVQTLPGHNIQHMDTRTPYQRRPRSLSNIHHSLTEQEYIPQRGRQISNRSAFHTLPHQHKTPVPSSARIQGYVSNQTPTSYVAYQEHMHDHVATPQNIAQQSYYVQQTSPPKSGTYVSQVNRYATLPTPRSIPQQVIVTQDVSRQNRLISSGQAGLSQTPVQMNRYATLQSRQQPMPQQSTLIRQSSQRTHGQIAQQSIALQRNASSGQADFQTSTQIRQNSAAPITQPVSQQSVVMQQRSQRSFTNPSVRDDFEQTSIQQNFSSLPQKPPSQSVQQTTEQQRTKVMAAPNQNSQDGLRGTTPNMGSAFMQQQQQQKTQLQTSQSGGTFQRQTSSYEIHQEGQQRWATGGGGQMINGPVQPNYHPQASPGAVSFQRTDSYVSSVDGGLTGDGGHYSLKIVQDTAKHWYLPYISREEAIQRLRDSPPGSFIVRDSSTFPDSFGLAVKVSALPPRVTPKSDDLKAELVRHYLIEPVSQKGVRVKGFSTEPVFPTLAALIHQHTLHPMALPCRLFLPGTTPPAHQQHHHYEDRTTVTPGVPDSPSGPTTNVLYLGSINVESMTGANALKKAVDQIVNSTTPIKAIDCQVKVAPGHGVTLTDMQRKLFFRRHFPSASVSYCGLDPNNRGFESSEVRSRGLESARIFGFIAKKQGGTGGQENSCYVLCEADPLLPATVVINNFNKHVTQAR